jgi:hypothetical protein
VAAALLALPEVLVVVAVAAAVKLVLVVLEIHHL